MALLDRKSFDAVGLPEVDGNRYKDLFSEFTLLTGITVRTHHDASWFRRYGDGYAEKVRAGRLPGRFDRDAREAHVHVGRLDGRGGSVSDDGAVVRLLNCVFRKASFEEIFQGRRMEVLASRLSASVAERFRPFVKDYVRHDADAVSFYHALSGDLDRLWAVSSGIVSAFRFPDAVSERFANAFLSCAREGYYRKVYVDGRDLVSLKSNVTCSMDRPSDNRFVVVGRADSPAMRAAGFPDVLFSVETSRLLELSGKFGLSREEMAGGLVKSFRDPLAVFLDERHDRVYSILDFGRDDGFFAVSMENPARVVRRFVDAGEKTGFSFNARIFPLSPVSVLHDIDKAAVLYLKEGLNGLGMRHFPVLDIVEKKIGTGGLSVTDSDSSLRSLFRSAANIVDSFRNSKKIDGNFDPVKEFHERRAGYLAELEKTLMLEGAPVGEGQVVGRPVPLSVGARRVRPYDSRERIPEGIISKGALKKLQKAGISHFKDLFSAGRDVIARIADKKSVLKLDDYLSQYGKTLFPRKRAVSPEVFSSMDVSGRRKAALQDFTVATRYLPENIKDLDLLAPVDISGTPILGYAGFHVYTKYASLLKRWGDCPVFVTDSYLRNNGFSVNGNAESVNVVDPEGNPVSYYHVSDTDISVKEPYLYCSAIDLAKEGDVVEGFFNSLLNSFLHSSDPDNVRNQELSVSTDWNMYSRAYYAFGNKYGDSVAALYAQSFQEEMPYVHVTVENALEKVQSGAVDADLLTVSGKPVLKVDGSCFPLCGKGLYVVGEPGSQKAFMPSDFRSLFDVKDDGKNIVKGRPLKRRGRPKNYFKTIPKFD